MIADGARCKRTICEFWLARVHGETTTLEDMGVLVKLRATEEE